MNDRTARCLIAAYAQVALVEAMKIANMRCDPRTEVLPYNENDFLARAAELNQLSTEVMS